MIISLLALIDSLEDQKRFEKLYYEYEKLLFFIAKKYLGDEYLAEDAVNEAFIRIINNFDKIEEVVCPRTKQYAVVILRNVCADLYSQKKRANTFTAGDKLEMIVDSSDKDVLSSEEAFFQKYDIEIIQAALRELPEEYQLVLYWSAMFKKTREEIAELTNTNVETVKKRLYRARKRLREILEESNGR